MSSLNYKIQFPIGDWSGAEHDKCDLFIVKTNKPVEEVREIHFMDKKVLGFEIGSMCCDYEESSLTDEVKTILKDKGIYEEGEEEEDFMHSDKLLRLWLKCLKYIDPSFEYEVVEDEIPTIHFYGVDSSKRHLSTPGYGLFE